MYFSSCGRVRPSRLMRPVSIVADMATAAPLADSASREHLGAGEEVRDLLCGRLWGIRAVHDVLFDAQGQVGADGARGRLLRVRRAHDLAILRNGILAFQRLHDDRTGGHVADQILEEW